MGYTDAARYRCRLRRAALGVGIEFEPAGSGLATKRSWRLSSSQLHPRSRSDRERNSGCSPSRAEALLELTGLRDSLRLMAGEQVWRIEQVSGCRSSEVRRQSNEPVLGPRPSRWCTRLSVSSSRDGSGC